MQRKFLADIRLRNICNTICSLLSRILYAFVPQLIRTRCFNDQAVRGARNDTSWMNGLRGLASVAVFNEHFFYVFTYRIIAGYGTGPPDKWIHQLPILSLACDGVTGVVVFFTVGGYVCSYRALEAITAQDYSALFANLPGSVFRRGFRLYLPVFCSTFCIITLAWFGAFEPFRALFRNDVKNRIFPGPGWEPPPPRYETLSHQLQFWWATVTKMASPFIEYPEGPVLDFHLWTIGYEYHESMRLYLALVAFAACTVRARICLLLFLGYISVAVFHHYETICFFYAAALAQLDILRLRDEHGRTQRRGLALDVGQAVPDNDDVNDTSASSSVNLDPEAAPLFSSSSSRTIDLTIGQRLHAFYKRCVAAHFRSFLYFLALYLMSFPARGVKHPALFYESIVNPLIPDFYGKSVGPKFPRQVGTLLLLYLLSTVPSPQRNKSLWHRLLTCDIVDYLGRIMFGLFLIHGMVMRTFGYAIPHLIWRRWSAEDNGEFAVPESMVLYLVGLVVGWAVSFLVSLWVADVWTREVEGRCVQFTKLLEGWIFIKK